MADQRAPASLTEDARGRAPRRFSVLRPHLENGVPLARLARQHGLAVRTARRWLAAYRRQGLVGLTHRPRADRGQPRGVPTLLRQLIAHLVSGWLTHIDPWCGRVIVKKD